MTCKDLKVSDLQANGELTQSLNATQVDLGSIPSRGYFILGGIFCLDVFLYTTVNFVLLWKNSIF